MYFLSLERYLFCCGYLREKINCRFNYVTFRYHGLSVYLRMYSLFRYVSLRQIASPCNPNGDERQRNQNNSNVFHQIARAFILQIQSRSETNVPAVARLQHSHLRYKFAIVIIREFFLEAINRELPNDFRCLTEKICFYCNTKNIQF